MKHFSLFLKLFVFTVVFPVYAGSYDDFFAAISRDDAKVVAALLKRGFDPNTVSPKGMPGLVAAVQEPAPKVVDVLLAHPGTRLEDRTPQDESALMLAALKGNLDLCKKLIAHDADVNKAGWTPLHYAATGGYVEVMRLLLDNHAYIDAASPNGSTPLMMAAMYGTDDAVKLLLEAGADATLKNGIGVMALDFARKAQRENAATLINRALNEQLSKPRYAPPPPTATDGGTVAN